ncbi:MAG TPA: hypothetical protein VLS89_13380 [Candidatus Nanopelagicales bacterium]|nr:hypothetical protein [Candidatus Nanopelagicales bacterium]
MTKRAILWCGQFKRPEFGTNNKGRWQEIGDPTISADDFKIQANGLELAFEAVRALGVSRDEVHACLVNDDLRPQRLSTPPRRATVADLRRLLGTIKARAAPQDPLIFIAVNHGGSHGLVTADPVDEFGESSQQSLLTPLVLDECLGPLPGPQVIVIASCYAGIFLPLGASRPDRVVLASCAREEVYRIDRGDLARSAFLDELFGAWCAVSLSDAIPRERLSLDLAFDRARERLASQKASELPLRAGAATWPP